MRMFVNPYSGKLMDMDQVPVAPGGAKWCPDTGRPLNAEAVEQFSYPGPVEDREKWKAEQLEFVKDIHAQADEPNHVTLGISPALPMHTQPAELAPGDGLEQ